MLRQKDIEYTASKLRELRGNRSIETVSALTGMNAARYRRIESGAYPVDFSEAIYLSVFYKVDVTTLIMPDAFADAKKTLNHFEAVHRVANHKKEKERLEREQTKAARRRLKLWRNKKTRPQVEAEDAEYRIELEAHLAQEKKAKQAQQFLKDII